MLKHNMAENRSTIVLLNYYQMYLKWNALSKVNQQQSLIFFFPFAKVKAIKQIIIGATVWLNIFSSIATTVFGLYIIFAKRNIS